MSETMGLVDAIAAAIRDDIALYFMPVDRDDTQLPTGIAVGARHQSCGLTYAETREVGIDDILFSRNPEQELTRAIIAAIEPVVVAAIEARARAADHVGVRRAPAV